MKVIEESYEVFNEMLADEVLTNEDKIQNLYGFISVVERYMPTMILQIDELKECNDLLKTLENKIKELEEK